MTDERYEILEFRIKQLEDKQADNVDRREFAPIKSLVYAFIGAILFAFLAGIIALIWKQ